VVPFFPSGSVHIAVVDPGVGTDRRAIGLKIGNQYFIVPDNGLITPILQEGEQNKDLIEIVDLNNPTYWLPNVSQTFHGRDIFAPTGAHLAAGVPLSELGDRIHDPLRIEFSQPKATTRGWEAHITIIDVFGNLTTDLPAGYLEGVREITIHLGKHIIHGLVPSYGHREPGDLIALVDSENFIEIGVVNGSATSVTNAKIGDVVEVILHD
jgi:hypothetical protein